MYVDSSFGYYTYLLMSIDSKVNYHVVWVSLVYFYSAD